MLISLMIELLIYYAYIDVFLTKADGWTIWRERCDYVKKF